MKRLPFLNSFRFIAALGVLIQHSEEILYHKGISFLHKFDGIKNIGGTCVTAFFVLSGFLITYLLIQEKEKYSQLNKHKFYNNRVLRIWPLYFFILILYKILLPQMPFDSQYLLGSIAVFPTNLSPGFEVSLLLEWLLLLLILPQVLLALGKAFFPLHLWSIGVEELFYTFWPIIISKTKRYQRVFLCILIAYLIIYFPILYFWIKSLEVPHQYSKYLQAASFFIYCQRISCMAIGALAAEILISNRTKILKFVRNYIFLFLSVILLLSLLAKGIIFPIIINEVYSILFAIIILNLIAIPSKPLLQKISLPFEKLGEISFGIYMYHPFCIILTVELISWANIAQSPGFTHFIFYILIVTITFFVSWISFHYFEKPIMQRFRKV
jgi:peptidoglycan/LPS O-acetylase OafA/YrhL